jgi:Protein of unknown function (DUF1353)
MLRGILTCVMDCYVVLAIFGTGLSAQQPIRPVPLTPFADGENSVLMADLRYQVGTTNFTIVVPLGFVTDFASTPRALWAVLPPFGTYQLAAVVHDFLYWDQGCSREQADALLRVAMFESKVEARKRGRDLASGAAIRQERLGSECYRQGSRLTEDQSCRRSRHPASGDVVGVSNAVDRQGCAS